MKKLITAVLTGALFGGLIVLLGRYDVAPIGEGGTSVGFSKINGVVHNITGVNMLWYEITDYIGYGAIALCLIFALAGFIQMIKRRSLIKVDGEILALGVLFAADIALYIFFEKYIVNYRPIIMPGETEPEASFPSSHTMLILTVMLAVMIILDKYVKNRGLCTFLRILCALTALVTVCGRLYCGVHWFTDIVGGVLLSLTLILVFSAAASKLRDNEALKRSVLENPCVSERDKVIDGYRCKH